MKKSVSLFLAICMLLVMAMCPAVYAAGDGVNDSDPYDSGGGIEISTSGGKQIRLEGHVSPTIISVTMPSYIPFDISAGVERANKVVSPKITVENHSKVGVTVAVDNAEIDITSLGGSVEWKSDGNVGSNGLAVGFSASETEPNNLDGAIWLAKGKQDKKLMALDKQAKGTLYVVGDIGEAVPQDGTFTVIPTLVVKKTAA